MFRSKEVEISKFFKSYLHGMYRLQILFLLISAALRGLERTGQVVLHKDSGDWFYDLNYMTRISAEFMPDGSNSAGGVDDWKGTEGFFTPLSSAFDTGTVNAFNTWNLTPKAVQYATEAYFILQSIVDFVYNQKLKVDSHNNEFYLKNVKQMIENDPMIAAKGNLRRKQSNRMKDGRKGLQSIYVVVNVALLDFNDQWSKKNGPSQTIKTVRRRTLTRRPRGASQAEIEEVLLRGSEVASSRRSPPFFKFRFLPMLAVLVCLV